MSQTQEPLVYILVLCYQQIEVTRLCLESLRKLTYGNHRILILDNGSPEPVLPALGPEFSDMQGLRFPSNLGYGGANNKGIAIARERGANYVWLLNNDTEVRPDSLSHLVSAAAPESVGAAASVLLNDDQTVQTWGGGEISLWTGLCQNHTAPVPAERLHYLQGASLLLKMKALEDPPFWERLFLYWEDADLGFRLRGSGWRLEVAERSVVSHYGGKTVAKRSRFWDYHYTRSSLFFYRRHARFAPLPICWSVLRRLVKRCLQGRYSNLTAVLRAVLNLPPAESPADRSR